MSIDQDLDNASILLPEYYRRDRDHKQNLFSVYYNNNDNLKGFATEKISYNIKKSPLY